MEINKIGSRAGIKQYLSSLVPDKTEAPETAKAHLAFVASQIDALPAEFNGANVMGQSNTGQAGGIRLNIQIVGVNLAL